MAIEPIGVSTGGTTTAGTMPSYAAGDLLIAFSFRDGSTSPVVIPEANGWTILHNAFGANICGHVVGYMIAPDTSVVTSGFTNATSTVIAVYRGVDPDAPIGAHLPNGGSSNILSYLGLTLENTDGTSWIVGFAGTRNINGAIETTFDGFSNRALVSDATDEIAVFDSNGGRSSFSTQNASIGGTASGWRTHTLELKAAPAEGGVNASLSQTLGNVTADVDAAAAVSATTSQTLGNVTADVDAAAAVEGSVTATLSPVSISATGSGEVVSEGALTATLDDVALDASGAAPVEGSGAQTLGEVTTAAAAESPITAEFAQNLNDISIEASATQEIVSTGQLNATIENVTAEATAEALVSADAEPGLSDVTATATAEAPVSATAAVVLSDVSIEATGTQETSNTGAVNAIIENVEATASARTEVAASVGQTLEDVTLSTVAAAGLLTVYVNGAFAKKPAKVFVNGQFEQKPVKRYTGSAWTLI